MAIDWGSYSVVSGTGLRVGIQDEGQTAVTNASTTCTQSFTDWSNPGGSGASGSNYNGDNCTVSQSTTGGALDDTSFASVVDGSANGSSGPTTEQHGGTHTVTWTYSDYGTPHSVTVTIGITGLFNGSTPTKAKGFTFPARPFAAPTAPSGATATRINDAQVDLSWTNNSTASGLYQSTKVYRSADGGAYALIATLGVVTSYSDTTVSANHKYTYKIEAINTTASTQSSATTAVYTTPGAPTALVATKLGSGNIQLDWTNNVGYGDTAYTVRIEESQNGGAFSELTSVSGGVATYEHVAPSTAVTHAYKVRARSTTGSLNSSYSSNSNTVVLLSTAGAPTGLSPSGAARDAASAIVLSWTHNPTDGTPQSKRRVQVKVNAGSFTDAVNDTSTTSSYTISAATWTNGDTITWKVATAGQNGTLGSFSAESSFTLSAVPTVAISAPTSSYNASTLVVEWGYFQAQSSAQAAWQASLYDDAAVLIETITGTTETEGTFTATLADATDYTVTVTVVSAAGLSSLADSQAFTVTYLPPADIAIVGTFDNTSGASVLALTGDSPSEGVTVAIATVDVQRSIDGGPWLTILTGIVLDGDGLTALVQDTVPITIGTNTYRAIAYSTLPSSVMSDEETVLANETTWGYLNGGEGFGTVARVRAMPSFDPESSRDKALYHFAGRPKPVQLTGEALSFTLGVQGHLTSDSGSAAEFEALGQADGVLCWRGPDGRRIFGSVPKIRTPRTRMRLGASVSFTITELDFAEGDQ